MSAPGSPAPQPELTDEEVQKLLAGEAARGPRTFRGRELARYTAGLRDLVMKVVRPTDTAILHDVVVIHVLTEAHGTTPAECLDRRRALIGQTDDVETFRAKVSIEPMDSLSDEEIAEARRVVDDILKPVQIAQVVVVPELGAKKRRREGEAEPDDEALLIWPLAAATGYTSEHIRWDMSLCDVLRARHAQLWLGGSRCRRAGAVGNAAKARRRARFDKLAAKYAGRN